VINQSVPVNRGTDIGITWMFSIKERALIYSGMRLIGAICISSTYSISCRAFSSWVFILS